MRSAWVIIVANVFWAAPAFAQAVYMTPRTSFGAPDLEGVWSSLTATPLERPAIFDGPTTTEEKAAAFAVASPEAFQADTSDGVGARVSEWWEFGTHMTRINGEIRTSLIVDPQDGKMPYSEAGRARLRQLQHVAKGFHVLGFPGRTSPKAGQNIGGAQQPQVQTRQSAHSALGNDGWCGLFHKLKRYQDKAVGGCRSSRGSCTAEVAPGQCQTKPNKKGRPVARAALWGTPMRELLGDGGGLAETVAEFLHAATHVVHRLLRAGVEGVRLAGRVQLVPRQLAAVFHFDHLFGVGA
jgi:hypothetical protein